jgi:hypothetical protein
MACTQWPVLRGQWSPTASTFRASGFVLPQDGALDLDPDQLASLRLERRLLKRTALQGLALAKDLQLSKAEPAM